VLVILTLRINAAACGPDRLRYRASHGPPIMSDDWLRFGTFSVTLDGGQTLAPAYQRMLRPVVASYGHTDSLRARPLFTTPKICTHHERASRKGWQITAHCKAEAPSIRFSTF